VPYGTVVGADYMVLRPLRKGAMGALYVVEQLSTSGTRALKIMRREYVSDDTLYKRFEREAQMAAKIPSEHVTQIIAAGVDAKLQLPWIAMELLEGQHLGDYVEEHGPLPKETVREIAEQVCHAMSAAHSLGIVHRDLKPANIFLGEARRVGASKMVKVLDFGVARVVRENLTLNGSPLGTPSWMSPEQARGEAATPASDVWALGLIAFYMLTGRLFWRAAMRTDPRPAPGPEDDVAMLREVVEAPIPIASMRALELGVFEQIPKGFDQWFALCVARDPGERFVSAAAAYAALRQALG
jgi:serine/threonine protein kinase